MTSLANQLDIWARKRKWDKIIRAIEKLKPEGRTSQMNVLLSRAYLQLIPRIDNEDSTASRDLKEEFSKRALEALVTCSPEMQRTALWNSYVGGALINLFRYGEAFHYVGNALANALVSKNEFLSEKQKVHIEKWLNICSIMMRYPVFPEPLKNVSQKPGRYLKNASPVSAKD